MANGRPPKITNFNLSWKTTSIFVTKLHDIYFKEEEKDKLNFFKFERPQFVGNWKTTLISFQMEDDQSFLLSKADIDKRYFS